VQENIKVVSGEETPMWRKMALFLIPLMLSNALQSIGQLIGTIVVGRWLGVNALAAISAFFRFSS
jgi:Na+-driven multidrug efflux pump